MRKKIKISFKRMLIFNMSGFGGLAAVQYFHALCSY